MSKFLRATLAALALLCVTAAAAPAAAQLAPIVADSAPAGINISTATTTKIITGVANKKTYVNYAYVHAAGTDSITFEYGTGSSCASGTTAIGGALALSTSDPGFSGGNGTGAVLTIPAGQDLCILTTQAIQVSGWLQYAQY